MSSKLPINLEDLLRQRKVEGDRIEYKKGWNPDPIMRTLCAFANDFENLGSDFLKELDLTEGRSTVISKVLKVMKENGSPSPEFETDDDRSYFLIRLPAHPKAESDKSARSGAKQKTSGKTSGKILTEIRNNRNVTSRTLRTHPGQSFDRKDVPAQGGWYLCHQYRLYRNYFHRSFS
jgi:predicted HTH transcriptional regulator